jgi:hypothetical protein
MIRLQHLQIKTLIKSVSDLRNSFNCELFDKVINQLETQKYTDEPSKNLNLSLEEERQLMSHLYGLYREKEKPNSIANLMIVFNRSAYWCKASPFSGAVRGII